MKPTVSITFLSRLGMVFVLGATLAACGGSSGGGSEESVDPGDLAQTVAAPDLDPADQVILDTNPELIDPASIPSIGGEGDTLAIEDNGDLLPAVFPTTTTLDLAYAQAGAALVTSLNDSLALPADISPTLFFFRQNLTLTQTVLLVAQLLCVMS